MSNLPQMIAAQLPPRGGLVVGLSGGMDSVVLLHALRTCLATERMLRAIHIHHGLQAAADEWEQFCRELCRQWRIPLEVIRVSVAKSAAGLENRARIARYDAFARHLRRGEVLLLAHHLDDQLETVLLRLSRGAGPRGLSGIPSRRRLGEGALIRPLLHCAKAALRDYAEARGLRWMEDPSNLDTRFDRNFCRSQVLPLIAQRWPDYRQSWQRSRVLLAESGELLDDLARLDLLHCAAEGDAADRGTAARFGTVTDYREEESAPSEVRVGTEMRREAAPLILRIDRLRDLSPARRRNVLRHWLALFGAVADWRKIHALADNLPARETEAGGAVDFPGLRLRRYQGRLHLLPELTPLDAQTRIPWHPAREPELALSGNGLLRAIPTDGAGLADKRYEIRYRRGGETCRLGNRPRKTLKKILNEAGIPPWLRERLPLLFTDGELAAIPGVGTAAKYAANPGYHIEWHDPEVERGGFV